MAPSLLMLPHMHIPIFMDITDNRDETHTINVCAIQAIRQNGTTSIIDLSGWSIFVRQDKDAVVARVANAIREATK